MHRAARLTALICLVSSFAARPAVAVELNYTVHILGLSTADATFGFDLTEPSYRVTLEFHTTGIADLFIGDRLREYSVGTLGSDGPMPAKYVSGGRLRGQDRTVDMTWHDGTPVVTALAPPNNTEREDVPPAQLAHVMTPLDAIVLLLHNVNTTGRCEGTSRAYDGRRLQLLTAVTVGEDNLPPTGRSSFSGPALRCTFNDHTLAGWRIGAGRDEDLRDHKGTIWLARLAPGGQMLPVRVSVETRWFGDATIYLTSPPP